MPVRRSRTPRPGVRASETWTARLQPQGSWRREGVEMSDAEVATVKVFATV